MHKEPVGTAGSTLQTPRLSKECIAAYKLLCAGASCEFPSPSPAACGRRSSTLIASWDTVGLFFHTPLYL